MSVEADIMTCHVCAPWEGGRPSSSSPDGLDAYWRRIGGKASGAVDIEEVRTLAGRYDEQGERFKDWRTAAGEMQEDIFLEYVIKSGSRLVNTFGDTWNSPGSEFWSFESLGQCPLLLIAHPHMTIRRTV